jgi:hypothetical protein
MSGQDEVQFGAPRSRHGRLAARALTAAVVAVAVVVGAVHLLHSGRRKPAVPAVNVIEVGHALLGVRAGWELFARGTGYVFRIQLARGRIIRTTVPALDSPSPVVSFLAGPREAVVRSFDYVPGYAIPDGAAARPLTGAMAGGGPMVAGPAPGQVWLLTGSPPSLQLVTLAGRPVRAAVRLEPAGPLPETAVSDGRGDVLLLTVEGGMYDVGPSWYQHVNGQVIAIGPTRWLALSCRQQEHCRNVVIDPGTGASRTLPGPPLQGASYIWPPAGVISPDGSTAAILDTGSLPFTVHLVDLRTGATTALAVSMGQEPENQAMAWSPDGQWLFVAADGKLLVVNARTRRVTSLGIRLPAISQLTVRTAPR